LFAFPMALQGWICFFYFLGLYFLSYMRFPPMFCLFSIRIFCAFS
jgi:hypothetical protein